MSTFSLCSLSLFLFSTWYQSYFLVVFTRQNPVFLRCYEFTVSSPRSQTLAVSAFLGILISEFLFDSKQPSLNRSHQDLSIETKIGRIKPRTRPHAPPEVSGSPATRARAPTCARAPTRLTRVSFLFAMSALVTSH